MPKFEVYMIGTGRFDRKVRVEASDPQEALDKAAVGDGEDSEDTNFEVFDLYATLDDVHELEEVSNESPAHSP